MLLVRLTVARHFFLAEIPQHALADVFQVGGAFAQVGIRHPAHGFQEMLHHRVEGELGILAAAVDGVGHAIEHRAVFQHHQVRLEDPALLLSGDRLNALLQFIELDLGFLQGGFEPLLLGGDVLFGNLVNLRRGEAAGHDMHRANSDPR